MYNNTSKKLLMMLAAMIVILVAVYQVSAQLPVPNRTAGAAIPEMFASANVCAFCHSVVRTDENESFSFIDQWRASMLGHSSIDPLWRAKVSAEVKKTPMLFDVIEDKCSTCHMPMAHTQAVADNASTTILDDRFLSADNEYHSLAAEGISCTLCHQILPDDLEEKESWSGHYQIDEYTNRPDRKIYGPYAGPFQQNMKQRSGFNPTQGKHMQESALCATCHNLYTPYTDEDGNVLGEFPEQTPYSEWENSIYAERETAKSCQDCHMPEVEGSAKLSTKGGNGRRTSSERSNINQHSFIGSNAYMLSLILDNRKELDSPASSADLENAIESSIASLESAATLEIIGSKRFSSTLRFDVEIWNQTGHKFPTGFPSRRAWLHVKVKDGSGVVIFESGKSFKNGRIVNGDADLDRESFEKHYTRITSEDQVQIYESIMGDYQDDVTYTLLRGATYLKDNRIPPAGFYKDKVDDDIKPGKAAMRDANFDNGSDRVTYEIPLNGAYGPFTVEVELKYQTVSYRFKRDLLGSNTDLANAFDELSEDVDNSGTVVQRTEVTVQ